MEVYSIKQLKQMLSEFPDDTLVFMSSDEEGNSICAISNGIADTWYDPKKEIMLSDGHTEARLNRCKKGIILYPQYQDLYEEYSDKI